MARRRKSTIDQVPVVHDKVRCRYVNNVTGRVVNVFRTSEFYVSGITGQTRPSPYVYAIDSSDGPLAFTVPIDQIQYPYGPVGKTVHFWKDGNGRVHFEYFEQA
jgi:hypothetical protein